jgi:hypothetical protein
VNDADGGHGWRLGVVRSGGAEDGANNGT